MTTETRKRIRAYKKMLPELRERVIAVALLLAMSASMLGSASFAWITLSRSPEVSGMSTTVAANGNLEIALASGKTSDPLKTPDESAVGDSSATEEQSIVGANVTWGNLVNVSDPTYGLNQIALRPALLSDYNRKDYPLNGASYGGDGRVVSTNDRYEFASYEKLPNSDMYYFAAGADASGNSLVNYGVRAIASMGYVNYSGNTRLLEYLDDTSGYYRDAQNYYGLIISDEKNEINTLNKEAGVTCISALEGLVTVFAQDKINEMGYGNGGSTKTSCSPYLWYTYRMMCLLEEALVKEGTALLELANWQAYIASGDAKTEHTFATADELISSEAKWSEARLTEGLKTTIRGYKSDLNNLRKCINGIKPMSDKCTNPDAPEEEFYWDDIAGYVNILVDINSTTMNGLALKDINGIKAALKIIGGGDVVVYKGVLRNIEARLVNQGNRVKANVKVKVQTSIAGNPTVKGVVYTDVGKLGTEPTYAAVVAETSGMESSAKGEATAKDTYGLALDLWLRTNYPDAVLTLEGSAKYEEEPAYITVKAENGTETTYRLHTITISDVEMDVYQKDDTWYYASSHSEVAAEDLNSQIPKEKFNQIIVGYEGENRVWEDWREMLEGGYIERDATTQGSGSCFVFYAATPTEQAKIMEMLEAFNVAFIDQNGDMLGTAQLNLKSAYANQGKVTVPLEVVTGVEYTDESGNAKTGITTLAQNEPKLVTAIVYLNGSKLQNENVLASGELQGQLNIQFGTNSTLVAPDNEELASKARTITASVTVNGETITNGTIGGTEGLPYKPEGYPATVTLNIEGDQPERISGFFVRVINETQGTRGEEVKFTPNADGTWTGAFTQDENGEWTKPLILTNPGTYAFDTLQVDGVQYTLHDGTVEQSQGQYYPANRPKVYIQGLKLSNASVDVAPGTYMTADTSKTFKVTAVVEAAVEPSQVNAQFFSDDKSRQFTAILKRIGNTNTWEGTVDINASGTYSLDYVSVDGTPISVPASGSYTLYLGLTARISTTLPQDEWEFFYTGASQITMRARVYDDGGTPIENLSGVKLTYNNIISPAALSWTGQYYEGVFDILQPGELSFHHLDLGNVGTIYSVNSDAPRFMAISLETPSYVSGIAPSQQNIFRDTATAKLTATLKQAETATVWAEIRHAESGETLYIESNETGNTRTFTLPREDGNYTLNRLLLQQVYDKEWVNAAGEVEGKWYPDTNAAPTADTESSFFILSVNDTVTTEVLATYTIDLYYDADGDGTFTDSEKKTEDFTVNLSGTKDNPQGTLFQGYRHNDLKVVVTDYKGRSITGVAGSTDPLKDSVTKMVIAYDNTTDTTYGGYDGASVPNIDIAMNLSDDGTYLTLVDADTGTAGFQGTNLIHSGVYTATITVDVAGLTNTLTVHPKFTVATKKPTLTIDSISPSGQHSTVNSNKQQITVTSAIQGNNITIYPQATVSTDSCGDVTGGNIQTQPTVKLKLKNLGNAESATLTFTSDASDGAVRLYTRSGSGQTNAYTWNQSTGEDVTRYVGYYAGGCSSSNPAGTLTSSNTLVLKVGESTYNVGVSVITIANNAP